MKKAGYVLYIIFAYIAYLTLPFLLLWIMSQWQEVKIIEFNAKIGFWFFYLLSLILLIFILGILSVFIVRPYTKMTYKGSILPFENVNEENEQKFFAFIIAVAISLNFFLFNGSIYHRIIVTSIPTSSEIMNDIGWAIVNLLIPSYAWFYDMFFQLIIPNK